MAEMRVDEKDMLKFYCGLSLLWIDIAITMNDNVVIDPESEEHDGACDLGALVVAQVSFGFAIELAYKSLLIATGKEFIETHDVIRLHGQLPPEVQKFIEWCVEKSPNWGRGRDAIEYVNEVCCNPNIRYFGYSKRLHNNKSGVPLDLKFATRAGRTIGELIPLHTIILETTKAVNRERLDGMLTSPSPDSRVVLHYKSQPPSAARPIGSQHGRHDT